jgi:CRISPR/Cas system-associated exonuclease Cas4 (RecB family)
LMHVYYQTMRATGLAPGDEFLLATMQSRIEADLAELTIDNLQVFSKVWKMFNRFATIQSPKIDNLIEILDIELEFEIPVVTPAGREISLYGFIDLVYKDRATGTVRVRDHKTSSDVRAWSIEKAQADQQLLFYAAACTRLYGFPVGNVEISFINSRDYKNVEENEKYFNLFRHSHNATAVERFLERTLQKVDRMVTLEPEHNYSKACASCEYWNLCSLELRGLDITNVMRGDYERVDRGYSVRRAEEIS